MHKCQCVFNILLPKTKIFNISTLRDVFQNISDSLTRNKFDKDNVSINHFGLRDIITVSQISICQMALVKNILLEKYNFLFLTSQSVTAS